VVRLWGAGHNSELQRLLELWPRLSDGVRAAVLLLVSAEFKDVHSQLEHEQLGSPYERASAHLINM